MVLFVTGVLAIAFFAPAIFAGQVPIFRDFFNILIPLKLYAAHAIANGRLPLWAPEGSFGVPFLANYESGVLYPLSALVYVFPNPLGIGLFLAAHLWIAGVGIDALLRRRGISARARVFAAVVMMLGGVTISIAGPGQYLAAAAWMPWLLVAVQRFMSAPAAGRYATLVALIAVQALAGAPEVFAQSAMLVAADAWVMHRKIARGWRAFVAVGAAGVLAIALCAVQILPTYEYFSQTERSRGLSEVTAFDQSLEPKTFSTLLSPHRLDRGVATNIAENEVPIIWSIYIGLAPLALAIVGMVTAPGRRWTIVLAASVVLALGRFNPVYRFLYALVPQVVGVARYPQKFLITAHLAAVVLAAVGFARVERWATKLRKPLPDLAMSALLCATLIDLWAVHEPAMLFYDWGLLSASVPAAVVSEGVDGRIFQYERTAAGFQAWLPRFWIGGNVRAREAELWAKLAGNVPLVYGLGYTNGLDSLSFARPPIIALHTTLGQVPLAGQVRMLKALGVRFLVGEDPLTDAGLETEQVGAPGRSWIYRLEDSAPRIYLARTIYQVTDWRESFRLMSAASFDAGSGAVVVATERGEHINGTAGSLRIVRDDPEVVSVETESAERTLIVVGDSFFPGWEADLDGQPTALVAANGGLARAVELPAGKHAVTMRYRPASFRVGLMVSSAALVALALSLLIVRRFDGVIVTRATEPPGEVSNVRAK